MSLSNTVERLWQRAPMLSRCAAYLAALAVAAPFLYHILHGSKAYYGLLEDDHFYYTVVADNLVSTGRMTYDGISITNGFHPLWFVLLVLLRALTGGIGDGFYAALALYFVASVICTYELGRRYAIQLGASPALAAALSAVFSLATAQLIATGMECGLAIPLFMWWLIEIGKATEINSRRAAYLGFLSSLVVLARLDLCIAVALALMAHVALSRTPWRRLLSQLVAFGAGGVLLPIYLASNLYWFGALLPVSAIAKQQTTGLGFNLSYPRWIALKTQFGPAVSVLLPLGLLAGGLLLRNRPKAPIAIVSGLVALLFAAIFFFINSMSGWIVFGWYLFPLPAALLAAMVLIYRRWQPADGARALVHGALLVLVAVISARSVVYYTQHGPHWDVSDNSLLAMTVELGQRTRKYDGMFAMGASAGMGRVEMERPVLQIEALISDLEMVDHLRRQDPLGEVLLEHNVSYLVATYTAVKPQTSGDCVLVQQPDPEWAGKRTKKLAGWFCGTPVEHFFTQPGTHSYSQFPAVETFVWDLRHTRWEKSLSNAN